MPTVNAYFTATVMLIEKHYIVAIINTAQSLPTSGLPSQNVICNSFIIGRMIHFSKNP